ncbi:hypothetical protein BH09ACT6_BH09ACT6_21050 [soil metagenome]
MVDDRPKPKYGELAPEGWTWKPPAPQDSDVPVAAGAPGSGNPSGDARGTTPPPPPGQVPPRFGVASNARPDEPRSDRNPVGGPQPIRAVDLSVTSLLLFLGVLCSASMLPALFDFSTVLAQAAAAQGYGSFAPSAAANTMGVVAGIVTIVLQLLSIVVSVRRISRRKLAFPVPLAIGVVTFVVWVAAITFAFFNDPSFVQQITAR